MAVKQNKELQEQNHQLRLQVEFESNQNISLRSQMNTLSNRVTELQQSEKHFRSAYLEVRNQLQNLSQRNKDLQQALSSKEMEQFELQRDMKSANENVQFLQERIVCVKNEMKVKEREAMEADNRLKKCKETVIKLQENLRSKMDNLQQALMKNGELETKMAVLQRESAQMKNELKSKSSLSEKRVQELLSSFAQQRTEMTQMQKIINSKIEENISLTANNRLLQSLVEKYTSNEWDIKQQQKGLMEKFQRDECNYKKRIDNLIQEYGKLEQEQVCNSEVEQLQELKNLMETKTKEMETILKNKDYQIRSLQKEKDIFQRENEGLDKLVYDSKQQQLYILKEKDSIISQLQTSVLDKEKELKEVNNKISQIQVGIQQAQQYFSKYQQLQEEHKKLKVDIDLRDQSIKSLDKQLNLLKGSNNSSGQQQFQGKTSQKQEDSLKYKEKFVLLDEKYQGLKKKFLSLQQQSQQLQSSLNQSQQQQQQQQLSFNQTNSIDHLQNEIKLMQNQNIRLRQDKQQCIIQIAKLSSQGPNDISSDLSSRVHQLCEFVLSQLEQTSKDLLQNIPEINGSIEQNMMFMVHAFNNLFEDIKTKDGSISQMFSNEIKQNKKVSSLEKEVLLLKKKVSSCQPSTASSSAMPTPKASVSSSVYKMPFQQNIMQGMGNSGIQNIPPSMQNNLISSSSSSLNNSFTYKNEVSTKYGRDLTNNEHMQTEMIKKKIKF